MTSSLTILSGNNCQKAFKGQSSGGVFTGQYLNDIVSIVTGLRKQRQTPRTVAKSNHSSVTRGIVSDFLCTVYSRLQTLQQIKALMFLHIRLGVFFCILDLQYDMRVFHKTESENDRGRRMTVKECEKNKEKDSQGKTTHLFTRITHYDVKCVRVRERLRLRERQKERQ